MISCENVRSSGRMSLIRLHPQGLETAAPSVSVLLLATSLNFIYAKPPHHSVTKPSYLKGEPCPESAERVLPKNANSGGKIIHS